MMRQTKFRHEIPLQLAQFQPSRDIHLHQQIGRAHV